MRNQLGHLTPMLLTTFTSLSYLCGCTKRATSVNAFGREIVSDIVRDLDLPDHGTDVVELTNNGNRDVAIVLTNSNAQYTLWCVYRSRDQSDRAVREWKLWMNYATIEDGTGAEEPAKREYAEMPDAETIAVFKADMLKHWSNK